MFIYFRVLENGSNNFHKNKGFFFLLFCLEIHLFGYYLLENRFHELLALLTGEKHSGKHKKYTGTSKN